MLRFLSIFLFLTFICPVFAQQALLNDAVAEGHCAGLAAGILHEGEIAWLGQAGHANLETNTDFTPETISRIASIAKPMTAVAVMQLVETGKLQLDDPVSKYLPVFADGEKSAITVRHLLQHTAGIRGYESARERENETYYPTLADALQIFVDSKLLFTPGTDFSYTSYGYVVLGLLIEQVSGLSYEAYLQSHVWEPAGMTYTSVEYADVNYAGKAALYHQKKPGKIKAMEITDLSDRIPGGGVQSTVHDLLKFAAAVLDGTLLSAESLAAMAENSGFKKEGNGYGMGWYLYGENNYLGHLFGHNGEQLGCTSFLMLIPASNSAVAVMTGTSGAKQEVGNILNGLLSEVARRELKND